MPRKLQTGFTLVELIIVVAIISILASIAIPAYNGYIETSKRSDAQASLMALAIAQEKYRATNPSYTTVIGDLNGVSSASESGYYTLAVTAASGATFTATATPDGWTDSNGNCSPMSINQDGPTGTLSCWGR
jgi:type IV pilus assembly protein PilE